MPQHVCRRLADHGSENLRGRLVGIDRDIGLRRRAGRTEEVDGIVHLVVQRHRTELSREVTRSLSSVVDRGPCLPELCPRAVVILVEETLGQFELQREHLQVMPLEVVHVRRHTQSFLRCGQACF